MPSIPKIDPDFTMEDLRKTGAEFLKAGHDYWEATKKAGLRTGAVTWVSDTEDGLVIFTRGEYRSVLLRNIEEVGPVYHFGSVAEDE